MRWYDTKQLVEALEDNYSDLDLERLQSTQIQNCISKLLDFSDDPKSATEERLEEIHKSWILYREELY